MLVKRIIQKNERSAIENVRMTKQRRLLLDILQESGGHIDADEIYREAKIREPRINKSTVYRNLQVFAKLGLVEERHFDNSHHHYEFFSSSDHYHLRCLGCGKIIEFESGLTDRLKSDAAKKSGFQVTGGEFLLVGYCSDCRRRKNLA